MDAIDRLLNDDPAAWAVHADQLLEAGDPRGELVGLQAERKSHRELTQKEARIVEAHGLVGPMSRPSVHRLYWRHGYFESLGNWARSQRDDFWHALFGHPSATFLRSLAMRWIAPGLFLEVLQRYRPPLRYLHWNERDAVVDLDPYFEALPYLDDLRLWRPARFERGPVRPLKGLAVNTGDGNPELRRDLVRHARAGGFAALDDLEVWGMGPMPWVGELLQHCAPRSLAYKGSIPGEVVAGLVESPAFATLEVLAMEGFWPHDAGFEALVSALEARTVPLKLYRSTGREPSRALRKRIKLAVEESHCSG
ncbi:MAG: hypothetical protein R3F61_32140 [Myxococcota bacterium]